MAIKQVPDTGQPLVVDRVSSVVQVNCKISPGMVGLHFMSLLGLSNCEVYLCFPGGSGNLWLFISDMLLFIKMTVTTLRLEAASWICGVAKVSSKVSASLFNF